MSTPQVNVSVTLAEFLRVSEGKVDSLGTGWHTIGPEPRPFGVLATLQFELTDAPQEREFSLELVDSQGQPCGLAGNDEPFALFNTLALPSRQEHGRDVLDTTMPMMLPPVELRAGDHEFVVKIDGETRFGWSVALHVHAPAPVVATVPVMATDSPIYVPGLG